MKQRRLTALVLGVLASLLLVVMISNSDPLPDGERATYVGQQTCMTSGCHASTSVFPGHEEYQKTMHANIHNRPTPENVVIDRWFEIDTVLRYGEQKVRTEGRDTFSIALSKRGTQDQYWIRMFTEGEYADTTDWFKVAYNYGGNGWIQRFLLEIDGNYYPAPFQYSFRTYRDTVNDDGPVYFLDLARFYTYNQTTDAIEFFDRGTDDFLSQSWDKRCASCHVNGFDVHKRDTNEGQTKWIAEWAGKNVDSASRDINIAIGCESCHGPGSAHVANPTDPVALDAISPKRWGDDQSTYWTDRKLDLCNQCHNRMSSTQGVHTYPYDDDNNLPYIPKLELEDYEKDPITGAQYWEGTRISAAHHQQGQDYWRGEHYTKHIFPNGCFDCHSPHENTEYPYQLDRNWYSLQKREGCLATGCHAEEKFYTTEIRDGKEVNVHTQHMQENSQCVNCHYTKTATIAFTGKLEFSDHSDQVIRPTATIEAENSTFKGVLNTCAASCHRNGYGERNRPDAFDNHVAYRLSGFDGEPMKAPDYDIKDRNFDIWKEKTDIALADSLWLGYKELYAEYVGAVNISSDVVAGSSSAIASITPNPASTNVTVTYSIVKRSPIRVVVYNMRGEYVRLLDDFTANRGTYTTEWRLNDEINNRVPAGMYVVRVSGEGFSNSKTLIVQ